MSGQSYELRSATAQPSVTVPHHLLRSPRTHLPAANPPGIFRLVNHPSFGRGGGARWLVMRVIGVDLGRTTAVSLFVDGVPERVQTFTVDSKEHGPLFREWRDLMRAMLSGTDPELVAYEYVPHPPSSRWQQIYNGMVALLLDVCERKKIPYVPIPIHAIKIRATGKGNAKKPAMVEAATQQWPELGKLNHNEADALFVALVAVSHFEKEKQHGKEENPTTG